MIIKLYKCDGCWRTTDNYATSDGTWIRCLCGRNKLWQVNPTKLNLFKWIIHNPKYIFKLFLQDIREKYRYGK